MFTFVTGGLRSGKSEYALQRASELGPPPWLYVAPAIEGDDELKARLAKHRRDQEATWRLLEAPEHLEAALEPGVPDGRLVDVVGMANQILSERASAASLLVSGLALRLR